MMTFSLKTFLSTALLAMLLHANVEVRGQDHGDYCYFTMMLDNSHPLPVDLGTAPAALLVSVIDYTNIYIPVDWERRLASKFIARAGDMGIDYKVVASGMALNKTKGDPALAKKLKDLEVKNIVHYTVVYQRTPQKIKTGYTIAVMPFTGDASIVDMAGKGNWYSGPELTKAVDLMRKDFPNSGAYPKPEFMELSTKQPMEKVVGGMPALDKKSRIFMHGYYPVCVPGNGPSANQWKEQYGQLAESNLKVEASREQLDELLHRYDQRLRFIYLTQDTKTSLSENDYLIVPIDDPLQVIKESFMPFQGKGMMAKVPHDLENPYYQFALFHPSTGTLYVPTLPYRGYGSYFDSLEDLLKQLNWE